MRRLGTLGTKSLVTLAGLWLVASCSGGSDDDFSDAMGGETNAGRAGGQSRAGTGGKSQAGAGNDAGQAGMAGDGGAAPSTGGRPTVDPDPGGAGGVPTIEPVAGAGGAPVTPEGGAGGEPVTPMGGAGGEPVNPVGGAGGEPGNDAGAGGSGGDPGVDPRMVFDFESGAQGFAADGANVTIGTSTAQTVAGTQSLKVTLPSMADETRRIQVDAAFWPGSVIELNVWVPEGDDDLWVQPFSHINFYEWDSAPAVDSLVRGGWTKWTYTVPKTFPGGMQRLGIQFGAGARPFAGGDVYVDAITVVDGPAGCSGEEVTKPTDSPGRREFDFESDSPEWVVDEGRTDVVLSRSGDHVLGGTSALKAALTAIPAGESRKIVVNGPETFCGDTVTFNVWTPADSDGLNLQAYMLVNDNWAWVGAVPPAIDRGAYTEITLPVPTLDGTTPIGPGGYRILGIQVENGTGAPFTGDIYIDDVSYQ